MTTDGLAAYLEHFRARVLQDALNEATAAYWLRRAATFDAVGNARCDEIAQACRNRAAVGQFQEDRARRRDRDPGGCVSIGPRDKTEPGDELLDDVEAFLARFVAFPSEAAQVATTLWAAHAHAVTAFDSSPRLALLSPEPGAGTPAPWRSWSCSRPRRCTS